MQRLNFGYATFNIRYLVIDVIPNTAFVMDTIDAAVVRFLSIRKTRKKGALDMFGRHITPLTIR